MKRALVIVDYVYDFVADDGKLTCGKPGQDIEKSIIRLIEEYSNSNDFIVVATDNHDINDLYNKERAMFPEHCSDEKGCALYGDVEKAVNSVDKSKYLKIDKSRYSAFCATPLDLKLKERKVEEICIVGVCTDICVLHTAVDAYNLGYKIVVPKDAVASFNQEGHEYCLNHFKNVLSAKI